jgi:hypothetical protein
LTGEGFILRCASGGIVVVAGAGWHYAERSLLIMPKWLRRLVDFLLQLFGFKPEQKTEPLVPPKPKPLVPPKPETIVKPEYRKTYSLMTFQERKFYRTVLLKELGSHYLIFSKVRLGDLIWIANEPTEKKRYSNQIQCKHIDFVLCDKSTLEPVLVIELDDSSHDQYDRRESDQIKNHVCAEANLPLLRIKVVYTYDSAMNAEDIRSRIQAPIDPVY